MTLRVTNLSGFAAALPPLTEITLDQSRNNVNLFTEFGEPALPNSFTVLILNGVTIGSSNPASPALTTGPSFQAGSDFTVIFQGSAQVVGAGGAGGMGGHGGDPRLQFDILLGHGGGGGGGQGSNISLGGLRNGNQAFNGQNGSLSQPGSGGASAKAAPGFGVEAIALDGLDGGPAIETFFDMVIDGQTEPGDGRIYGGGGGGFGGVNNLFFAGELPGMDGLGFGLTGGANDGLPGAAIIESAGTVTYLPSKGALDIRGAAPA